MFFLKQGWYHTDLWHLQDPIPSFHNLIARGKSTLDGYDIMANNWNLYAEYEWHFHFRNLTVQLYSSRIGFKSHHTPQEQQLLDLSVTLITQWVTNHGNKYVQAMFNAF